MDEIKRKAEKYVTVPLNLLLDGGSKEKKADGEEHFFFISAGLQLINNEKENLLT